MKKSILHLVFATLFLIFLCGCASGEAAPDMVLVDGGTYLIGSPEDEPWRSADEALHEVTLDSFYIGAHEVTQAEYEALMGTNPSAFIGSENPVEGVTWLDAVAYCNARSLAEGLTPAYVIEGQNVIWNRAANG